MTTVPAPPPQTWGTDILNFALSLGRQKDEEKRTDIARRGVELDEKKLSLAEKQFEQDVKTSEINQEYLLEQMLTMRANRELAADMAEYERQEKVARAAGNEEQARALRMQNDRLAEIKASPDGKDILDNYLFPKMLQQELAQQRMINAAQSQELQSIGLMFRMQQGALEQKQNAWDQLFGTWDESLKGTPLYPQFHSMTQQYVNAPDEMKPELWDKMSEVSIRSMEMAQEQRLSERGSQIEQQKSKEASMVSINELKDNPDAFLNKEQYNLFMQQLAQGKTPNIKPVPAGILQWLGIPTSETRFTVEREEGTPSTGQQIDEMLIPQEELLRLLNE